MMLKPLLYIGLSQAFFAAFIVLTKKPRLLSDVFLGIWLLMIVAETSITLFLETVTFSTPILNITIVLQVVYMPLMYLYVSTAISEKPKFSLAYVKHILPFMVVFALIFLFRNEPIFWDDQGRASSFIFALRFIFGAYFLVLIVLYTHLILKALRQHQHKIQDSFSYTSERITLNWLKFVLFLFVAAFLGHIIVGALADRIHYPFDPRVFVRIALTVFAFGVSYFGVKQPTLYEDTRPSDKTSESKSKYERSGLTDHTARTYQNKLQQYMESEKPYLDPELTIKDVADRLKISRHHITQVINENLQKNFFTWINEYRVQEVKQRLLDDKFSHLTIVAIAYDCGFNSKSAFNSIFKKETGQTPSEFRRIQEKVEA
jgi:AraC-like DNA-binding protein